MKKRLAVVDDDAEINAELKNNSSSELNVSKPIITSVLAAQSISSIKDNETKENDINEIKYNQDSIDFLDKKEDEKEKSEEEVNINTEKTSDDEINKEEPAEEEKEVSETENKDEVKELEEKEEITETNSSAIMHNYSSSYSFTRFEKEEEPEKIDEHAEENNLTKSEEKAVEETTEEKELENKTEEVKINDKPTYSKSDIFKRPVIIPSNNDEEIKKSVYEQHEIDKAIQTAPTIDENDAVENYQNYNSNETENNEDESKKLQELKEKDIKIIETEDELKTSALPEIEKKPAEPYVAPAHSIDENKKSNKIAAIVGIIIIILGLSFLGVQFFSGKNNELDDDFYEIVTNETISPTNDITQTNNAVNTLTNTARPQTNNAAAQTNTARPQTNNTAAQTNTVRPQTNNTAAQTN
ncbi:hypothetical protein DJ52_03570, partial [Brachyspira murdochii]